jgi:DNA-binding NarL/FixJ family response regulator
VLLGIACGQLGDSDGAELEREAAHRAFAELGAAIDLERLTGPGGSGMDAVAGLSRREAEVLALVAAGKSNKAIALELSISEKTVARHVSNILAKLDLSSRTEAAVYAFRHGLAR